MGKRILTLDDLVSFCKSGNLAKFNASESGYKLSVQAPAVFESDQNDQSDSASSEDDTLFYGTVKAFHTGENRNGSFVPEDAAAKAMSTMAYKPILAYINCFDEATDDYDFTSHQIEVKEDGEYEYIESQVGCFTADAPYIEYDKETNKNFVYAKAAIPRTYTKAAEIIEKKGGTKVSVELAINSMSWNSDTNLLVLEDFTVEGCTLLGRSIDYDYGSQVEEGMQGAKFIIDDFAEENNSVVKFSHNENMKLIETLEKLNTTLNNLSNLSIDNNSVRKEESLMDNEKELNGVVSTEEDITTPEAENIEPVIMEEDTNQETVVDENAEAIEPAEENSENVSDDTSSEEPSDEGTPAEENNDESVEPVESVVELEELNSEENVSEVQQDVEPVAEVSGTASEEVVTGDGSINIVSQTEDSLNLFYSISHDDIRYALYNLIYKEYPGEALDIASVYDDHFIMYDWDKPGIYWSQGYISDSKGVSLTGYRIQVYAEFVTEAEKAALNLMRNTYASMETELHQYKLAEMRAEKEAKVVNSADYDDIKDTVDFKALVNDMDKFSLEEMINKADLILAKSVKLAKKTGATFASNKDENTHHVVTFASNTFEEEKNMPYGGIFEDYFKKHKK